MYESDPIPALSPKLDELLSNEAASSESLLAAYDKVCTLAQLYGTPDERDNDCWYAIFDIDDITTVGLTKYGKPFNSFGLSPNFLTGHVKVLIKDGPVIDRYKWCFDDTCENMRVTIEHERYIPHSLEEAKRLIELRFKPPEDLEPEDIIRLSYDNDTYEENNAKSEGLTQPTENQVQELLLLLDSLDPTMVKES